MFFSHGIPLVDNEAVTLFMLDCYCACLSLQTTLRVRDLPDNICDPDLQSSFAPPIRRACAEFPLIAEKVMQRNGLGAEEFNELQHKLDRNMWFRFKVQREIKKLKSY